MSHLATDLRSLLERTVVEARDVAELGARAALEALGVSDGKVPGHLKPEERDLRVRLRARARQLGDPLDATSQTQAVDHLAREVAYEHWHRMLFARFLAQSHLLVEPESGVAISLAECRELARERNEDPWVLAGRFAERMLPAIFRSSDPALALALPPERLNRLEALLEALPAEVFAADDALGWVYQFWQSKRKKEVNASGRKIGADELPAVTQLFTEPYMVQFLLHNTLGAWHAGRVLAARPEVAASATSEEELRRACSLPGYEWTYLRFVRDPANTGPWRPGAGTFPGWPSRAADVTFIDPCCGSGHFLVEAFAAFVALRQAEEGLELPRAVRSVLADNLHGLEIDARCTQLAAFAVAYSAWRRLGRVEPLPPLHIACSGLAVGVAESEWLKLVGEDAELRQGMERLHFLFQNASTLGSLPDPRREVGQDLFSASLDRLENYLIHALGREENQRDPAASEVAVTAAGMALTVDLLLERYSLVATNVPYLARKSHDPVLLRFINERFADSRADLATVFLSRILDILAPGGTAAVVTPQNWLFLGSYEEFRRRLLRDQHLCLLAKLGPAAFQEMNWWAANTLLSIVQRLEPAKGSLVCGLDVSGTRVVEEKAALLRDTPVGFVLQASQLQNPSSRITLDEPAAGELLSRYAEGLQGISPADQNRFIAFFWEMESLAPEWTLLQSSFGETAHFAGRNRALRLAALEVERGALGAAIRGRKAWGRGSVMVRHMNHLPVSIGSGQPFDADVACILPIEESALPAIWAFCSSDSYREAVRRLDQKTQVTNSTLVQVPFDLARWGKAARESYPKGLPEPWSEDPVQWIFHGHPARSRAPLQVAVARLVGYRWPVVRDPATRLSAEAREWVKQSEELDGFGDKDGIVCLSSLRNEETAAARLRGLLAVAFGNEWGAAKEGELLAATPGQAANLEDWLRERFFEEHCALFHQRPFIWHVWDGRKDDGFHALVDYHRLAEGNGKGRQLLESLAYAYLGEWIDRQRRSAAAGETGAEARLAAAVELQGELKKILDGEPPYDIFVRWKPLHRQPIGWEPDIDDGVRLNARPFLTATLSAGRAGAGLFRAKPNIHWKKDRGAEPQRDQADFPWFYGSDGKFHGERHNDLHLSLDEKRRAREAKAKGGAKR